MSRYGIQVRNLVKNNFDFGLRNYPIFDENYRRPLNNKLIEHFYMREIGQETAGLFKFYLNRTMNEIMPLYNQYYKSALLEFEPFQDKDIMITDTRKTTGTSDQTGTGTTTSDDLSVYSDTPQSMIAVGDIKGNTYASNADWDNANATSNSTNKLTVDNLDEYTSHIIGTNGGKNYSEMLQDFRATFLNIDMMVLEDPELQNCFMLLYR